MDTKNAARAWVAGWTQGWENADPEPIAALYAPDVVFRSHPFREPERSPRDYAVRAFADEQLVQCRFGEPVVDRDWAAVEYWAILRADGEDETLAGIALIRFGTDGLVVEQRDYWVMQPGRREPSF